MRRLVLLAAVAAALVVPAAAGAHASLVRSVPADDAALAHAPARVVLVFDDGIEVAGGNAVVDADGKSVLSGKPHANGKTLILPLRSGLAKGDYTARWSALSDDGHTLEGIVAFSVGTGRPPGAPVLSASSGLGWFGVLSRVLAFAGLLAAVGLGVFDLAAWRPTVGRPLATGPLAIACVLVFLGAHGLTHASHSHGWNRFSFVWEGAGIWAAVGAMLAAIGIGDERVRSAAAPFVLALVVAPTLAGHALDPGRSWIEPPLDAVHVAAASVWFGGLVALVFAVPRDAGDTATPAARRFSRLALLSVAVVAVTGVGRALSELASVSQAWTTGYGRALIVKTVLLGLLVGLGWLSRDALRGGFARLRLPVRAELAPALGVAIAIAFLTALPPGRSILRAGAATAAASAEPQLPSTGAVVSARQDRTLDALLSVDRGRASVVYFGQDGSPTPVPGVRIEGRTTSPCGRGCYATSVGSTKSLTVTHGPSRVVFDLRNAGDATRLVQRISRHIRSLPGLSYHERLSSGTVTISTTWRAAAPDRVSYTIRGGAQAVIIGNHRWDRQPGSNWVKSAQSPVSMPQPAWGEQPVTNARIITRKKDAIVLSFLDRKAGPAWFEVTVSPKTLLPRKLMMVAPAHFMHHSYFDVGKRPRIEPPT
jgi:copper transport protein